MEVTKTSGQTETFDTEKLRRSLLRSGADEVLVNQVLQELAPQWEEGVPTRIIFKRAFKLLKRLHRPAAARYSLKQAMLDFGNTGFPFEDFIAQVFYTLGYQVKTRQLLPGLCVQHEVDVVAEKNNRLIWIECKYHPVPESVCNVKIPLYIHSRFRDLEQYRAAQPETDGLQTQGWVVTNTRFSDDAMTYGHCAGLHLVSWNYPSGKSLRELIEQAGVYPVNCLTTLTRREKTILLENGFVLTKQVSRPGRWTDLLHVSPERAQKIIAEAEHV